MKKIFLTLLSAVWVLNGNASAPGSSFDRNERSHLAPPPPPSSSFILPPPPSWTSSVKSEKEGATEVTSRELVNKVYKIKNKLKQKQNEIKALERELRETKEKLAAVEKKASEGFENVLDDYDLMPKNMPPSPLNQNANPSNLPSSSSNQNA